MNDAILKRPAQIPPMIKGIIDVWSNFVAVIAAPPIIIPRFIGFRTVRPRCEKFGMRFNADARAIT